MGVGHELEDDVVTFALHRADETLDRMAGGVLRVEIDRGGLDAPLAVLEDELQLLPTSARHRRGHDRRCRGARECLRDLADLLGVVLDHPAERFE